MSERCERIIEWVGRCKQEAIRSNPALCAQHAQDTCWCGAPATRECGVAGSFVCGRPLCSEHECNYSGAGMTGTGAHSRIGKQQYADFQVTKMEAAAHPWQYFQTAEEANEWLAFDDSSEVIEQAAFASPDQFGEWERWMRAAAGKSVAI